MSNFPRVDDNIAEDSGTAFNAARDSIFNIETEIGAGSSSLTKASGTAGSIALRLSASLNPDGTIKASALTGLGLITLPITDGEISPTAQIQESKLNLAFTTTSLNNSLTALDTILDSIQLFIQSIGFKIEPHIMGTAYNHFTNAINVSLNSSNYLKNKKTVVRDNSNLYSLLNDINTDLVTHERADGTVVGEVPPDNYGHVASGVYLNTSNFSFVPQTAMDLQQFAQFVDNSNILILGTRIQTLYANGISRNARASILTDNIHGQSIIPYTDGYTYLLN